MYKKCIILFYSVIIISQFFNIQVNGQVDYIDQYPGIPIIAHTNMLSSEFNIHHFEAMKDLGIMGFYATNITPTIFNTIKTNGLNIKLFPLQIEDVPNFSVVYYTDAIYTKWEAEGKGDGSNGDVELFHTDLGQVANEGDTQYVITNSNQAGELIYGPGYYQYVEYKLIPKNTLITYMGNYHMKIKRVVTGALPDNLGKDTVCEIQIVATNPGYENGLYPKDKILWTNYITVDTFLTAGWDVWKDVPIIPYTLDKPGLTNLSEQEIKTSPGTYPQPFYDTHYMQFKIIWKGLNYLKLCVDYIETYDSKGKDLIISHKEDSDIKSLVSDYNDPSNVLGFFGLNEPFSIDNYEPFRYIENLVKSASSNKLHLFTTFTTGWNGTFGGQYAGKMNFDVYKGSEFIKRSKLPYISLNTYIYDYPYSATEPFPYGPYNERNIFEVTDNNLKKLNAAGIPFSYSTQSGRFYSYDDNCNNSFFYYKNPSSAQMMYHINLGLLYGAKEITCDPTFTLLEKYGCIGYPYRDGLVKVNETDYTLSELGETWKDYIKPRLAGLFGQTLKKITPTEQHLNLNYPISAQYNYIEQISYNNLSYNIVPSSPVIFDIGFFNKNGENYFMIINRYYSSHMERSLNITINKNNSGLNNYKIVNYIDNRTDYINCRGSVDFFLEPGDTRLLGIFPVVKNGGELRYNESISGTNTLSGEMSIKRNAVLTVSGVYNIQNNINVEYGGEMVVSPGATLNFTNGATINVNGGTLTSAGNPDSKITYEFNSGPGIVIGLGYLHTGLVDSRDGVRGSFNISNCIIKDADIGISDNAITRFNVLEGRTINNCEFNNCNIGLSASNLFQGNIVSNNFTDCGMGMFLSFVQNLNIVNNNMTSNRNDSLGIMLNSCSGLVRNNTITGFNYGIMLANSSPLIGDNKIFNNSVGGIYIGTGSLPDMRGYLSYIENCATNWAVFPLSGYNKIHENGNTLTGSQLVFYHSGALMDNGYNLISDNRIQTSPLVKGSLCDTNSILGAINNCWGEEPYNPIRYQIPIRVAPINCSNPLPDYGITNCPIVITNFIDGSVIDTVYSLAVPDQNLSDIEIKLAQADEYMRLGQYDDAKLKYSQVITLYADSQECFSAYAKLRLLGTIQNSSSEVFSQLEDLYNTAIEGVTDDTLMVDMLSHLANLCLISEDNVPLAINRFNHIVVSHPGTDEATFAEIDAMTASLLLDTASTGLHKMTNNPYRTKGPQDYNSRIRNLIANKFTSNTNGTKKLLLPTECSLSQNYPNPFNPTTTIKYAIKEKSDVRLTIFDLLGRQIKTLVNETKEPGFYQVEFDGSRLASGVYFYSLSSKHFVKTNKMMILK
jgi:hypothetical protein